MRPPAIDGWGLLIGAGMLAYPAAVWAGSTRFPPAVFVLLGLVLIALRVLRSGMTARPRTDTRAEAIVFPACGLVLLLTLLVAPSLAERAYPVMVSLAFATIFATSLIHPPTLIERIARLREPNLQPAGIVYTRRVTWVWFGFLLINAAISAWTAAFGSLEQWLLWNGLLSYLAMGTLFTAEFMVRRMVRR